MATPDLATILGRLLDGFYPDCSGTRFHWRLDSFEERFVIRPTAEAAAKARKILRREKSEFQIEKNKRLEEVLACLMDETIRPETWLKKSVADVYRELDSAGLVVTIEAVEPASGALAGALLGVRLGRVILADTMFQLAAGASKACLCHLVMDAHGAGIELIDVQNEHEDPAHPARRLGEERMEFLKYLKTVRQSFVDYAVGNSQKGR